MYTCVREGTKSVLLEPLCHQQPYTEYECFSKEFEVHFSPPTVVDQVASKSRVDLTSSPLFKGSMYFI